MAKISLVGLCRIRNDVGEIRKRLQRSAVISGASRSAELLSAAEDLDRAHTWIAKAVQTLQKSRKR